MRRRNARVVPWEVTPSHHVYTFVYRNRHRGFHFFSSTILYYYAPHQHRQSRNQTGDNSCAAARRTKEQVRLNKIRTGYPLARDKTWIHDRSRRAHSPRMLSCTSLVQARALPHWGRPVGTRRRGGGKGGGVTRAQPGRSRRPTGLRGRPSARALPPPQGACL